MCVYEAFHSHCLPVTAFALAGYERDWGVINNKTEGDGAVQQSSGEAAAPLLTLLLWLVPRGRGDHTWLRGGIVALPRAFVWRCACLGQGLAGVVQLSHRIIVEAVHVC